MARRLESGTPRRKPPKRENSPTRRQDGTKAFCATLTEDQLHRSIAELLDLILIPPAVWTTFPAGWGKFPRATAGRLRACGLKPGFPDLMLFYEGAAFGIELKRPGEGLSAAQKSMRPKLETAGITLATCSSAEEVVAYLHLWKIPLRRGVMFGGVGAPISLANKAAEARFPQELA